MTTATRTDTALIAELNDLIQLDHDAVQAYSLALRGLRRREYQETVRRFRGDHERHITELAGLVRDRGGIPVHLPHIPTGAFKLAVQAAGAAGDDRTVILAFKTNERQVRDKYRRAANRHQAGDVADVLRRAAADEGGHYTWALETLEDLGIARDSVVGRAGSVLERGHAAVADAVEGVERQAMERVEGVRRAWSARRNPMHGKRWARTGAAVSGALVMAGVGILAARLLRTRKTR